LRLGSGVVLLLGAVVVGGCRTDDPDSLAVAERVPLPGSFTSLHIDIGGSAWLGGQSVLVRADLAGRESGRFPIDGSDPPRIAASLLDHLYFRAGPSVLLVDGAAGSLLGQASEMPGEAVAVDWRGRFVFRTGAAGAVLAHDARSLEPLWGWGAIGADGTALGVSPEGDRVYEAVASEDDSAELLIRDLQTGRILRRFPLADPIRRLIVADARTLYGVGWNGDGSGGALVRLSWKEGHLVNVWRRALGDLHLAGPVLFVLSPRGDRLAILAPDNETGLHVVDVETGRTVDRLRIQARDVAFDPEGRIFLLTPSELLRLE
jgi:hypothetical protein